MNTYHITNSNGMAGGVWSRSYESRKAAREAIAQAYGWDGTVISPEWSDDEDNACWSVYETQEECDADETGAMAPTITRREEGEEESLSAADVARWIEDVKFTIPPECQGQIVEVSYGCDADYIYARSYDRSDRTTSVSVYEHPAEECDFAPWNGVPSKGSLVGSVDLGGVS